MAFGDYDVTRPRRLLLLALAILFVAVPVLWPGRASGGTLSQPPGQPVGQLADERLFPQTGFRVADDQFWQYFQSRGGVDTFGYPTSRRLLLLGTQVQFFQRHVVQRQPDGTVGLLNLLDVGVLPYTDFGNATVPPLDVLLATSAPGPGTPQYGQAVAAFIAANVPNEWEGLPVGFYDAYLAPARASGETNPALQALVALELLGFPTSRPAFDPNNRAFVYQRFQRGVLHFDAGTRQTQPLLLADYLKALLIGRDIPAPLLLQASGSRFLLQYDSSRPLWLARPDTLMLTDLTAGFERDDAPLTLPTAVPLVPPIPVAPPALLAPTPLLPLLPTAAPPTLTALPTMTLTPTPISTQPSPTLTSTSIAGTPVLDGAEPGSAAIGQDIILRGKDFGDQPGGVIFTGKLTTAAIWSATNIIVTVPQGAVDGTIRIRRADGVFSNAIGFAPAATATAATTSTASLTPTPSNTPTPTLTPTPGPPVVSDVSPYFGQPGSSFFVRGSNFGTATGQILMGNSFAPVEANGWSDTSVAARVPTDAQAPQTACVFVRRPDGSLSANPVCFQVRPPPTATSTVAPSPTVVSPPPTWTATITPVATATTPPTSTPGPSTSC